jgi:predicted RNA methylase
MSLAPFVASPQIVVERMLKLAKLKEGETLYDLGCGDGRIIIMAATQFGANAVGVELDEGRYRKTLGKIRELSLEDKVTLIHGNLLKVDLSPADVVTLYLLTSANEKVKPNLEKHLRKGTRVVSHDFEIPGWRPIRIEEVSESYGFSHTIYLYEKK